VFASLRTDEERNVLKCGNILTLRKFTGGLAYFFIGYFRKNVATGCILAYPFAVGYTACAVHTLKRVRKVGKVTILGVFAAFF